MLTLQFDGLYRAEGKNSCGYMCYGWVIFRGKTPIGHGYGVYTRGKNANSSAAEYLALIEGLEALLDMGVGEEEIEIIGDAKSVIYQMQGVAAVSSDSIRSLHHQAHRLANHFNCLTWTWKPRRQNRFADALTRHALQHMRSNPRSSQAAFESLHPGGRSASTHLEQTMDLRIYQPTAALMPS
jgi:ribonuclease HI